MIRLVVVLGCAIAFVASAARVANSSEEYDLCDDVEVKDAAKDEADGEYIDIGIEYNDLLLSLGLTDGFSLDGIADPDLVELLNEFSVVRIGTDGSEAAELDLRQAYEEMMADLSHARAAVEDEVVSTGGEFKQKSTSAEEEQNEMGSSAASSNADETADQEDEDESSNVDKIVDQQEEGELSNVNKTVDQEVEDESDSQAECEDDDGLAEACLSMGLELAKGGDIVMENEDHEDTTVIGAIETTVVIENAVTEPDAVELSEMVVDNSEQELPEGPVFVAKTEKPNVKLSNNLRKKITRAAKQALEKRVGEQKRIESHYNVLAVQAALCLIALHQRVNKGEVRVDLLPMFCHLKHRAASLIIKLNKDDILASRMTFGITTADRSRIKVTCEASLKH